MSVTIMREIPLTKLSVWEGNVRKTGIEAGLDELAASIAAHGLLNPLTVGSGPKGRFVVIAGQRRLLALKLLAKAGTIPKSAPVACVLRDEEDDPSELSLAENVVRVAMHPADQFEAWRSLIDKGAQMPEIAARFGVAESTVRKRMTLGRVSPRVFAAYRDGELDLEALQAFTVTDDHQHQEAVFDRLSGWQRGDAGAIRRALTEGEVSTDDRRARFVGIDAYEAAGGTVRRDLFAEDGSTLQDPALLDRLAMEKLTALADTVQAEGWKWAEARLSFDWSDRQAFDRAGMEVRDLSDEEEAEGERLREAYDAICDDDPERAADIEARLDAMDASRAVWPDAVRANAGAVVYLSHGGRVEIERGLIRDEGAAAIEPRSDDTDAETDEDGTQQSPALPASLIEDLTAQRTAALRAELALSPAIALAVVVHGLATSAFYPTGQRALKLQLATRSLHPSIREHDDCRAVLALDAERQRVCDRLPGQQADLWDWCMEASQTDLLDILAVAAAHGLDAVVSKHDANHGGCAHGQALSETLKLDMAAWYRPTASGYFGRISKAAILADLEAARQAPCAPSWKKIKKAELAALAEREAAATGWLPEPLR